MSSLRAIFSMRPLFFSLLCTLSLAACAPEDQVQGNAGNGADPDESTNLLGDSEELATQDMLPFDRIREIAASAEVDLRRVTYLDMVPYDEDGDGNFLLVAGLTEVLPGGELLETYIDPRTGEVLAQEAPHAGLRAHILELGLETVSPSGTSTDTYESYPWGWALPYMNRGGYMTQGYNQGSHTGSIAYSTDWDPGDCGLPVYAPSSGWVMSTANLSGWGNQIVVAGACAGGTCTTGGWGYRYLWRLGHFQSPAIVQPGWWIARNRQVGYMGTTGNSTACHIHMTAYRGNYTGSGNISGESLPVNKWPGGGDSICNGKLAGYNFADTAMDYVATGSSGCP